MPEFCVNKNSDHEVHDLSASCSFLPDPVNRQALGFHASCHGAVQAAKTYFSSANGCYHCANACHTG